MPLVFQYGSNCDAERFNGRDRLNGDATDLGRVQTVDEYEIAFNKGTSRGYAAADLLKPRKGGRRIWGVLYDVSRAGFNRLRDVIEGPGYRPQRIAIEDASGDIKAVTTFRVRQGRRRNRLHTSAEYVGHIVTGLRAHGVEEIDPAYIQHVIDIALDTNRRAGETDQARLIESFRNQNPG